MTEGRKAYPQYQFNALVRRETSQIAARFLRPHRPKRQQRRSQTQARCCGTWRGWRKRGVYATLHVWPMDPYTVEVGWTSAERHNRSVTVPLQTWAVDG